MTKAQVRVNKAAQKRTGIHYTASKNLGLRQPRIFKAYR